ncbi:MAG TPA: response regulator [Edaphobacter sp.]|nr:response regulator [Edaphobacter sp.]
MEWIAREQGLTDEYFAEQSLSGMEEFTGIAPKESERTFGISSTKGSLVQASPSVILLVDDDPDIRSLTRTFLEHEGYSVLSSGNAVRALQIFRSVPHVDLLITDLYMPGQSGMELAQELKTARREMPVLMISGGAIDRDLETELETEGWRFLAKPFRLPELLATVHQILAPAEAGRPGVLVRGVQSGR